jgi:hypothetical protein
MTEPRLEAHTRVCVEIIAAAGQDGHGPFKPIATWRGNPVGAARRIVMRGAAKAYVPFCTDCLPNVAVTLACAGAALLRSTQSQN